MDANTASLIHWIDNLCVAAAFLLPVVTVLYWNRIGVILGALIHWWSLAMAGLLITTLDYRGGLTVTLDLIWFLFGWIQGLGYSLLIYGMKCLGLFLWKRRIANRTRLG